MIYQHRLTTSMGLPSSIKCFQGSVIELCAVALTVAYFTLVERGPFEVGGGRVATVRTLTSHLLLCVLLKFFHVQSDNIDKGGPYRVISKILFFHDQK